MSSVLTKDQRTRRGRTADLNELPDHVSDCLRQLARQFGRVGLWGSYLKGDWADDSDLDVRVEEPRAWALPVAQSIGDRHGLTVDVSGWSDQADQLVIEGTI